MSSYKIYLTRSSEVASLLAHARSGELKTEDVISSRQSTMAKDISTV